MLTNPAKEPVGKEAASDRQGSHALPISLPKGGGAIRGIGEKFAANPVTGTGSMSVPIATSPGGSGFGSQLALYLIPASAPARSGLAGAFSFPSSRARLPRTDLPDDRDAEELSVFMLLDTQDLVPYLRPDGRRFEDDAPPLGHTIRRHRPHRVPYHQGNCFFHWRSTRPENIAVLYRGKPHGVSGDSDRVFAVQLLRQKKELRND